MMSDQLVLIDERPTVAQHGGWDKREKRALACGLSISPPSWLGSVTATQRRNALAGKHPTGDALGPVEETCGGCVHYESDGYGRRRYA